MRTSSVLALLTATACLGAAPASAQDDSGGRSIAVTGTATVTAPNDTAGFSAGVDARRTTPGAALRAASADMRRVVAALRTAGVEADDIRTRQVTVRRVTRRRVVRYVAINAVSVVVRAIRTTGAVIDAAVDAGATRVNGPTFWRSSTAGLYRQALVRALGKARAKARALAADAGATLGDVRSITESGAEIASYDSAAGGQATPSPVNPGRTTVTADLTAVFAMS